MNVLRGVAFHSSPPQNPIHLRLSKFLSLPLLSLSFTQMSAGGSGIRDRSSNHSQQEQKTAAVSQVASLILSLHFYTWSHANLL